ncbi:MAG: hypothetical protein KatS3mg102_0899 [Planctomycetota bacterium]|nr:MAG: hypothetical protein KatS3mg102_0899 [Planctomycetota bacterium]
MRDGWQRRAAVRGPGSGAALAAALLAMALGAGVVQGQAGAAPPSGSLADADAVAPAADPVLVFGEYPAGDVEAVDGDTLRVRGLERPVRLLALDTEEVLHGSDLDAPLARLMREDFARYVRAVTEGKHLPVKYATPMGVSASAFAREFFAGAARVRLELDRPERSTGRYGRALCYAWAIFDDGRPPQLYNLEAVRAGMSPYCVKYGRSARFDGAFRAAQAEARQARRGIWDPALRHYPDYERRLAWWERRALALEQLERLRAEHPELIALGEAAAIRALVRRQGRPVTVWGIVDEHDPQAVREHERGVDILIGQPYEIHVEVRGRELARQIARALAPAFGRELPQGAEPPPLAEVIHGEALVVCGPLDRGDLPLPRRSKQTYLRIAVRSPDQIRPAHLGLLPRDAGAPGAEPPGDGAAR